MSDRGRVDATVPVAVSKTKGPPEQLTIVYCPTCGRSNLGGWALHGRHFSGGSLCRGTLAEAVYTRGPLPSVPAPQATPRKEDSDE